MTIRRLLTIVPLTLLAAWAFGAATPTTMPADGRSALWDSYRLIPTRNIFSRDRRTPSRERPTSYQPPARSSDSYVVLTGITLQEDGQIAFFEDTRTGETRRVAVGQPIGSGTLAAMNVLSAEIDVRGSRRKVLIGENLAGSAISLASPSPAPTSAPSTEAASGPADTTMPATAAGPETASKPADAGTSGGMSMEERMRLRRLQENK